MSNEERTAANAALLRLFKNEYRESSDRHSDALLVRDYVNALEWDQACMDWLTNPENYKEYIAEAIGTDRAIHLRTWIYDETQLPSAHI